MTINELEQGLRNLIATQPMITSGASGEVVTGILSMIDAFRNLSFKIQNYPCQDVLKFNMSNEAQKLENNFTGLVCGVLQERGINIMLYIPRPQQPMNQMVNPYGMINQPIDANVMMGQMMYQAAPNPMGMMNQMQQPVQMMPQQPMMNQMQPTMQMMGQPAPAPRQPRRQAATFPGYAPQTAPTRLEPAEQMVANTRPQAAPQSKVKAAPKASPAKPEVNKTVEKKEPSAAEMLIAGFDSDVSKGGEKAAGRDYLMELLKK